MSRITLTTLHTSTSQRVHRGFGAPSARIVDIPVPFRALSLYRSNGLAAICSTSVRSHVLPATPLWRYPPHVRRPSF